MSSSIIDLKTLGKPLTFDGSTEKWASWSFKFEAWCGLLPDVGTSTVIELMDRAVAATSDGDVMINAMGAESATIAQNLYYILVQVMGGRGLMIVKKAERGNGLLIWRRLKQEYEDGTGHRAVAMLMGIMTPNWPKDLTARGFSEKVDEWEADLDRYERQTTEMISDAIKVAVVLKHAPHEVQQALRMQLPTIHDKYHALRSAIQLLARGLTEYSNRGNATGRTDDAMEVDQIFYSKGGQKGSGKQHEKGKSKNKGKFVKGKTKDKSTKGHGKDHGKDGGKKQFDGTCYVCNKWGHMGRDCWHAPGKTEGKAGGKGSQVREIEAEPAAAMKKITAEHEDWSEQPADEGSWVFALSAHESMQKQKADLNSRSWRNTWKADKDQFEESLILIDSGSDEHVCGYAFAPLAPTRETTNRITMRKGHGHRGSHL